MSDCIVTAAIELDYYQPEGYEASLTRGYEPSHYYAGIKSLDNLGKDVLVYTTEEIKNPQINICQPVVPKPGAYASKNLPSPNIAQANKKGTNTSNRSKNRNSGYFTKSATALRSVS